MSGPATTHPGTDEMSSAKTKKSAKNSKKSDKGSAKRKASKKAPEAEKALAPKKSATKKSAAKKSAPKPKKAPSKKTATKKSATKKAAAKPKKAAAPKRAAAPEDLRRIVPNRAAQLVAAPSSVKRVCVLTGGGDAPALNAVLRGFVKRGVELDLEILGAEDGFEGLIQPGRLRRLRSPDVRGILPRGGSILGCSNRANPFAYPTRGRDGSVTYEDVSPEVIQRLHDHDIDVLVLIGGDGTQAMGSRIAEQGIPVIGVPKTIDNDLAATDTTFGFDSAVTTATWAIDALHSTAEAHDRVMIVEVMGRDAGWIAISAGIAGGADAILIPEIPYDVKRVAKKIRQRSELGSTFSIIVIGEGARPSGETVLTLTQGREGHLPRLGGAGHRLAELLKQEINHEVRVTVLGHLQRGGSPTAYDRLLGTRFGVKAAELCHERKTGRLVALRGLDVIDVPIMEAVGRNKTVDVEGELVHVAAATGIEMGMKFPHI